MPLFLKDFDYVVGNRPWVNWESLPHGYRQHLVPLYQDVYSCHDEVVVECDKGRGEETKRWLEKAMIEGMDTVLNGADEVHVPVEDEARIARSWGK